MKFILLSLFAIWQSTDASRPARHIRTGAPCPSEWDVAPCQCVGRPGAASMNCDNVSDAATLERIFAAYKEKVIFRDLQIHDSKLTSLPGNAFPPHQFFLFFLSNNSIEKVDKDVFKGSEETAQVVYLDGNKLTSFPFEAIKDLKSLEVLRLNHNQLVTIEDNAFPAMDKLQAVFLNSNKLKSLGKGAFSKLTALDHLDISNNQLTRLGERALTIDNQKATMSSIILADNSITEIDVAAFSGTKVGLVQLNNNKLTVLDETVFKQLLNDGSEIKVEGNPFDCEHSQMTWLKKLPVTTKQRISGLRCSDGKTLDELN